MSDPSDPSTPRRVLNYRRHESAYQAVPSTGNQIAAGWALWGLLVGLIVLTGLMSESEIVVYLAIGLSVIVMIIWSVKKWLEGWRAHVPGLLIGMTFWCLLPIGTLYAICGPFYR